MPPVMPMELSDASLDALYRRPLASNRSGALFGAFPYPTKISPQAIALYIAAHTRPGDTVFDGFAGSGTTGLAALLCEDPSAELRQEAQRLGLNVEWGPRNAILYEVGVVGAFIARTLTNPPDVDAFEVAAKALLAEAEANDGWLYRALDPDGREGTLRHVVWSDVLRCPGCLCEVTLFDACVSTAPAQISSTFNCPRCLTEAPLDRVERVIRDQSDDLLGESRASRWRRMAVVHGATGNRRWSRAPTKDDLALVERVEQSALPASVPKLAVPWGDLYRKGYHQGITHVHHFYTRRNLIAFARMWDRIEDFPVELHDALRFWLLSYNASHATIMTRVVAKTGQKDLVITSAQPGVLYVSGLPVEKNLFKGVGRKLKTIVEAFRAISGKSGKIQVVQGSSCATSLASASIDYVFTDPPFGANIPYAELNFLNEAWLNRFTDRRDEAIVSVDQGKSVADYQSLLTRAFGEVRRLLRPNGKATMIFHSASADIWNALQRAYQTAGFGIECAGVLDKVQGSFKQVTTKGAVRGDPVLLLRPSPQLVEAAEDECVWAVATALCDEALAAEDPAEATATRLYSRLVNHFLSRRQPVPLDAEVFYRWHAQRDCLSTV
jgi:16S rRNA G966 N2-methylase RsmD